MGFHNTCPIDAMPPNTQEMILALLSTITKQGEHVLSRVHPSVEQFWTKNDYNQSKIYVCVCNLGADLGSLWRHCAHLLMAS